MYSGLSGRVLYSGVPTWSPPSLRVNAVLGSTVFAQRCAIRIWRPFGDTASLQPQRLCCPISPFCHIEPWIFPSGEAWSLCAERSGGVSAGGLTIMVATQTWRSSYRQREPVPTKMDAPGRLQEDAGRTFSPRSGALKTGSKRALDKIDWRRGDSPNGAALG
jgi:hypothetical protein